MHCIHVFFNVPKKLFRNPNNTLQFVCHLMKSNFMVYTVSVQKNSHLVLFESFEASLLFIERFKKFKRWVLSQSFWSFRLFWIGQWLLSTLEVPRERYHVLSRQLYRGNFCNHQHWIFFLAADLSVAITSKDRSKCKVFLFIHYSKLTINAVICTL